MVYALSVVKKKESVKVNPVRHSSLSTQRLLTDGHYV